MIRLGLLKYKPVGESLSAFAKSANFLVIDLGAVPIMPERDIVGETLSKTTGKRRSRVVPDLIQFSLGLFQFKLYEL